ncbi:hypothetical protein lerEdw1_010088 [Lerista edwardsae]|nr:hypothetical protein lerEdw1_010088 [Lerista edwardsae]
MITCFCFLEDLQREPTVYFVANAEHGPDSSGCFPLDKQRHEMREAQPQPRGEPGPLLRDGPSRNSSFHSSEGEGTDHEGDILDCSGSRPLLMDSEEEEETGKENPQRPDGVGVSQGDLNPQPPHGGTAQVLPNTFQPLPGEASGEVDVFATAPFRSSRSFHDDLDIFTKAPFLAKSHAAAKQLDEGDVFLRAPFTKKKSQEELAAHTVKEPPAAAGFLGSAGAAQCVFNPVFQTLDAGPQGSPLPSMASIGQPFDSPLHSVGASEGLDVAPPKSATRELGDTPNDTLQGQTLPQETLLGSKASKAFRPQSLAKYSRHYSPEGSQCVEAQPIAAYKVVSQTNKQAVVGSVSIAPLSSRTKELPGSDPFASAPFPSKHGKQKP